MLSPATAAMRDGFIAGAILLRGKGVGGRCGSEQIGDGSCEDVKSSGAEVESHVFKEEGSIIRGGSSVLPWS